MGGGKRAISNKTSVPFQSSPQITLQLTHCIAVVNQLFTFRCLELNYSPSDFS